MKTVLVLTLLFSWQSFAQSTTPRLPATLLAPYLACIGEKYGIMNQNCDRFEANPVVEEFELGIYHYTNFSCRMPVAEYLISTGQCLYIIDSIKGPLPLSMNTSNPGQDSPRNPVCKKGSVLNLNDRSAGETVALSGLGFRIGYQSSADSSRPANRTANIDINYDPNIPLSNFPYKEVVLFVGDQLYKRYTAGQAYEIHFHQLIDPSLFTKTPFIDSLEISFQIRSLYELPLLRPVFEGPTTRIIGSTSATHYKRLFTYKPEVWGLGAWTLSNHHYYDPTAKVIHWGYGSTTAKTLTTKNFPSLGDVYMGTDDAGSEVYLFDALGRHLETRTSLMGVPIYQFRYLADHKLDQIIDRDGLVTRVLRDSSGQPTGIQAPFGQLTQLAVNSFGKLSTISDAVGATHNIDYFLEDGSWLMSSITYPSGLKTNFSYDYEGNFIGEQKSTGAIQQLVVDVTSQLQRMTFFKSNGVQEISTTSTKNGIETTVTKNMAGQQIMSIQSSNTSEFTDLGIINTNITSSNDIRFGSLARMPTSIVTNIPGLPYDNPYKSAQYSYSVNYTEGTGPFQINEMTTQENIPNAFSGSALVTTRVFNGVNKTIETSTSSANRQKVYLDDKERVTRIESSGTLSTNLNFNSLGQLERISQGGSEQRFIYDIQGNLSQAINPKGHATLFERNSNGQVLKKTLPNGDVVSFRYTSSGQVKEIQTPNGEVHQFGLSPLDQIISYIAPSLFSNGNETIYSHDSFGQIQSITKPSGQRADFFYKAGTEFVERIETPQGNYQFNNIDAFGRPREVISPDGIRTVITWIGNDLSSVEQYDGSLRIGQVIRQFTSIFNLTYVLGGTQINYNYDKDGRMIRAGDEHYIYQSANSTGSESTPETASITVETDTTRTGSYKRTLRTYQTSGETEGVLFQGKNTATLSWLNPNSPWTATLESFTDKNRQIIRASSKVNSNPTIYDDYQYDANNRLIQVAGRLSAKYDIPIGSNNNILRYQHGSQVTTAQYDKQDRLLSLKGAIERDFTYSDDGELTKISNCLGEKKFEYDFFGNLKKVTLPDGKIIQYKLDAFNRRVARSVNGQIKNYYLWQDQTHLWAILKPNGTIDTQYVYGLYSQAPIYFLKGGAKYIVLPNERGDIRYVLDNIGKVVQNIEYDEYGMVLNDSSVTAQNPEGLQPLGFASGLYDKDTKLALFNARSYDPVVGRWTSKDPIGFKGGDTNLYGYVLNDPINFVDPSGLAKCSYSKKTGVLSCMSNDANLQFSTVAFSGGPNGPAISSGSYKLAPAQNRPDGFFSLSRGTALDKIYILTRNLGDLNPVTGGLMIHPGISSNGCITVDARNKNAMKDYSNIQDLLSSELNDSTIEVTDD